jgi:hypothetical protein
MLKYRILHIPTGVWMTTGNDYCEPLEFRFKWFADRFLNHMVSPDLPTYIESRGTLFKFSKEEFCVVAVNTDVAFNSS